MIKTNIMSYVLSGDDDDDDRVFQQNEINISL